MNILQKILDWSEVWALFIPLSAYYFFRPKHYWQKPVVLYLLLALAINIIVDLIWFSNSQNSTNIDNNFLYNIHSFVRFFLFAWFFKLVGKDSKVDYVIPALFLISALVIFLFVESFYKFNSPLLALEAAILLFYCIRYFYYLLTDEKIETEIMGPVFLIVVGLCLYAAVNFFIFLFYNYLTDTYRDYAIQIWDIHNISYIVFCIFIAIAFKK